MGFPQTLHALTVPVISTSLPPPKEVSPVSFSCPDQCPSAIANDLVSFGGSDDEPLDDSMSLAASDAEDWSGSVADPAPLTFLKQIDARVGMDTELIRVLSDPSSGSCVLLPRGS